MNTGFRGPSIPFRSIHHLIQSVLSQLNFSFYRHQPILADFSGGQITSDAGLLPLRAFDQRHGLTRELAQHLRDPRQDGRVRHSSLSLLRQRVYQIVAGYEDANDADRLRHDPAFQLLADQSLGQPLSSQPTLSRWKARPRAASSSALTMVPSMLSSASAESRFGNVAKSCSMSIPPTIPLTDSNS
jgi:DDE family transposase